MYICINLYVSFTVICGLFFFCIFFCFYIFFLFHFLHFSTCKLLRLTISVLFLFVQLLTFVFIFLLYAYMLKIYILYCMYTNKVILLLPLLFEQQTTFHFVCCFSTVVSYPRSVYCSVLFDSVWNYSVSFRFVLYILTYRSVSCYFFLSCSFSFCFCD